MGPFAAPSRRMSRPSGRGKGKGQGTSKGKGKSGSLRKGGRSQGATRAPGPGRGAAESRAPRSAGAAAAARGTAGAAEPQPPGTGEAPVEALEGEAASSKATRALVEALRAFSAPQWWLIGKDGSQAEPSARRRMRPEEFQRKCTEKHAEMRKVYESTMMQDSEQRWLRTVVSEGTSGDKIASLTMLIQVCPVFATGYIKTLLTMAGKMGRSDSMMALDGLKDLFISTLLPDRKLKTFAQMDPVSPKGLSKVAFTQLAIVSYFEDFLKTAFAGFVHVLSEAAHSTVLFFKTKAIRTAHELLAAKPEQERALLGLLVNKFGDLASKVSSSVSVHIKKLVEAHPGMKRVVVQEIEAFLMRANITAKSRYSALLHLSEMWFTRKDAEVAAQLVRLFVTHLEEALRPKPVVPKKKELKRRKKWWIWTATKRRHGVLGEEDNRLVRTLINGIQRAMPYLEATTSGSPLQVSTVDALFKVCHTVSAFSTRIAILSLLFRHLFERTRGDPPDRFYRLMYEQVAQFDLFSSAHRQQACLLLQKCVPADVSVGRAVAMSRRLLQVGANAQAPVAVAALSLLRELLVAHRAEVLPLLHNVDANLQLQADLEDDIEERFVDDEAPGGVSKNNRTSEKETYRPTARDPRFARARYTPLWELFALRKHVHPFVAHGASKLLAAELFRDVSNNPFEAFAQSEVLEQFVLSSRPKKGEDGTASKARVPLNSERFSRKKNVLPHEVFLQLYFRDQTVRQLKREKAAKKEEEVDVDQEGGAVNARISGDEEDVFFDKYLRGQFPEAYDDEAEEDAGGDDDREGDSRSEDVDGGEARSEAGSEVDGSEAGVRPTAAGLGLRGAQPDGVESHGRKRRAWAELRPRERRKALRKQHAGSLFASAEDFEGLLGEQEDI